MGILDFIFGVLVLIVIAFIGIGAIGMKYDSRNLKKENEELKEKLKKRGKK